MLLDLPPVVSATQRVAQEFWTEDGDEAVSWSAIACVCVPPVVPPLQALQAVSKDFHVFCSLDHHNLTGLGVHA